eukprot:GHVU01015255.1.p1 GENE.GHVU01015255.1~~GHVU01015255.1.p1  ORF type:complete len:100 (+),score=13.31 GHVU01015255.1:182-481(+)
MGRLASEWPESERDRSGSIGGGWEGGRLCKTLVRCRTVARRGLPPPPPPPPSQGFHFPWLRFAWLGCASDGPIDASMAARLRREEARERITHSLTQVLT